MTWPHIIQGGMGAGVSGWRLASAVASCGELGVISGVALDELLIRKLQTGDIGGHIRRALEHFPLKDVAKRIIEKFFKENGKAADEPFINISMIAHAMSQERQDLILAGSFAETFLAKEKHNGMIGVNLITKIQPDILYVLYGCMLAGIDYVIMGAGIPREIPGVLDRFSENMAATLKLVVSDTLPADRFEMVFDPARYKQKSLKRPKFLAIVSSNVLAVTLAKKSNGKVDGFVVERHTAGGHNAPPRTTNELSSKGEPIYTQKDEVDLEKLKELKVPFWLAGGYSTKGKLQEALDAGAVGIQAGTPFMFCEESSLDEKLKSAIFNSQREVFSDPHASPAGFPFKVVQIKGTLSEKSVYDARPRICNLGYLRKIYKKADGTVGYRCRAESAKDYAAKGGDEKDTVNCKCLCNALYANIGMPAVYKNGYTETALVTAGDILPKLDYNFFKPGITAREVVGYLRGDVKIS